MPLFRPSKASFSHDMALFCLPGRLHDKVVVFPEYPLFPSFSPKTPTFYPRFVK